MLSFPEEISIAGCEKFLQLLSQKENDVLHLAIETKGIAKSFGGLAAAIQAINTWGRVSKNLSIEMDSKSTDKILNEITNAPHKFTASMIAKSIIANHTSKIEIKQLVYEKAKIAIEKQIVSQFGQKRGSLSYFTFVDHSSKGFDPNFYIVKEAQLPEPRQPDQIKSVFKKMVEAAMIAPIRAKELTTEDLDKLGRIFYELFLNTHEHGTKAHIRNQWIKPSVRVTYVQGINISDAGANNGAKTHAALSEYLKSIKNKYQGQDQNRFIEIGIVDSGLGYFERWQADRNGVNTDQTISIIEEYKIFKRCFNFRHTSTLFKNNKGNGLPAVLDRLTKLDGFMRVRSGRLALYRNFISKPFIDNDNCAFNDWDTFDSAEITVTEMQKVSGVAISLLVPLELL